MPLKRRGGWRPRRYAVPGNVPAWVSAGAAGSRLTSVGAFFEPRQCTTSAHGSACG
jgi:hypothetical protein